jgi:hypothetical protein
MTITLLILIAILPIAILGWLIHTPTLPFDDADRDNHNGPDNHPPLH